MKLAETIERIRETYAYNLLIQDHKDFLKRTYNSIGNKRVVPDAQLVSSLHIAVSNRKLGQYGGPFVGWEECREEEYYLPVEYFAKWKPLKLKVYEKERMKEWRQRLIKEYNAKHDEAPMEISITLGNGLDIENWGIMAPGSWADA